MTAPRVRGLQLPPDALELMRMRLAPVHDGGALGHAGSDHLTDERARQRLFFRQANSAAPSANKRAVRRSVTTMAMLKVRSRDDGCLHDALPTGDDRVLLLERNSEDGEYTRQQIQTPP